MTAAHAQPARAFTLVELLVTMGVIVALMGVLIPTLKGIQAEARSAGCMSNLRQVGTAIETYRQRNKDLLPMCEFIPVATDDGPQGGLPNLLDGTLAKDSPIWKCPADFDEDESLSTGTSYLYMPGLIRFTPQIQIATQQAMIPYLMNPSMNERMRNRMRNETESKLVSIFYEKSPEGFAIVTDSQDRHAYGDRNPRNALYLDGGVRVLQTSDQEAVD